MLLLDTHSWEVRITKGKGKGLFTKNVILPGTIIGDYLGKIIHPMDADMYEKGKHFYLMYYSDTAGIFPDLSTPDLYLINHSCTPNCWIYTYKGHTLFFALRKIFPGEELTISYLLSPQDEFCKPCTHICSCNGIICYQTMHLSPKRFNEWRTVYKEVTRKTKKMPVQRDHDLPALPSYPENITDHPIYSLFGNPHEAPEEILSATLPSLSVLRSMIRSSGKYLLFPKLSLCIAGVIDDKLIATPKTAY